MRVDFLWLDRVAFGDAAFHVEGLMSTLASISCWFVDPPDMCPCQRPRRGSILRKALIITAAVMALVMTACGADDEVATTEPAVSTAAPAETTTTTAAPAETTTTTTAPVPVPARDGTIEVTLTNWQFSPISSAVISGEPIVVNLTNPSTQSHTWALLSAGSQWTTYQDFDLEQVLVTTQGIPENGTDTVQFIAPEPGTYQVVCTVRGHIQRGMVAELVVEG